jgi:hypothetical protein
MGWLADLGRCATCDEKPLMPERDAHLMAAHTQRLQRRDAHPYGHLTASPCPTGNGWHVTRVRPPATDDPTS